MDGPPATPRALRSRARAPDIGDLLGLTSGKGTLFPGGGDAVKENVKENVSAYNVSASLVRRGSAASEVSNISRTTSSAGSKYRSMPGSSNPAQAASRQLATAKRHEGFMERMQKLAPGFKLPDKPRSRSASSERGLPAAESVNTSIAAEKPAAPPWAHNLVPAASASFQVHSDPLHAPRDWYSAPDRNPSGEDLGAGAGTVRRVEAEQDEVERARVEAELSAAAMQMDAELEESTRAQVRARERGRGRGGEGTYVLAGQAGAEGGESAQCAVLPRESSGPTGAAGVSLEEAASASASVLDAPPPPAGMQLAAPGNSPSPVRHQDSQHAEEGDEMEAEMEAWARRQMRERERAAVSPVSPAVLRATSAGRGPPADAADAADAASVIPPREEPPPPSGRGGDALNSLSAGVVHAVQGRGSDAPSGAPSGAGAAQENVQARSSSIFGPEQRQAGARASSEARGAGGARAMQEEAPAYDAPRTYGHDASEDEGGQGDLAAPGKYGDDASEYEGGHGGLVAPGKYGHGAENYEGGLVPAAQLAEMFAALQEEEVPTLTT